MSGQITISVVSNWHPPYSRNKEIINLTKIDVISNFLLYKKKKIILLNHHSYKK